MPEFDKEAQKEAVKQAIKEWLSETVEEFGWFTLKWLRNGLFAGLVYLALAKDWTIK